MFNPTASQPADEPRMNNCARAKPGTLICIGALLFLLNACHSSPHSPSPSKSIARDSRYPAHWWAPVSKEGAPDWEILPQEAGPGEVILSKRHELGLLSNFASTPFNFRRKHY